jgi:ribonuclease HI
MCGQYKVKNPDLRELYDRAQALVRKLEKFSVEHVLRERNREADRLVNQVLDNRR